MRPWSCIVGVALLIVATGIGCATRMCRHAACLSERMFVSERLRVIAALFCVFIPTHVGMWVVLEHENSFTPKAIWIATRA